MKNSKNIRIIIESDGEVICDESKNCRNLYDFKLLIERKCEEKVAEDIAKLRNIDPNVILDEIVKVTKIAKENWNEEDLPPSEIGFFYRSGAISLNFEPDIEEGGSWAIQNDEGFYDYGLESCQEAWDLFRKFVEGEYENYKDMKEFYFGKKKQKEQKNN